MQCQNCCPSSLLCSFALYALHLYNVHVFSCIPGTPTCVRFELVKSPCVTLCGWRGYKPWINNNNYPFLLVNEYNFLVLFSLYRSLTTNVSWLEHFALLVMNNFWGRKFCLDVLIYRLCVYFRCERGRCVRPSSSTPGWGSVSWFCTVAHSPNADHSWAQGSCHTSCAKTGHGK